MNLLRRIAGWFKRSQGDLVFPKARAVGTISDVPDDLDQSVFYIAGTSSLPKWAVFICPCERPHRVTLSLQSSHRPHWRVRIRSGRVTVWPSVDVRDWRRCHYWIRDGRVQWVPDLLDDETGAPRPATQNGSSPGAGRVHERAPDHVSGGRATAKMPIGPPSETADGGANSESA